MPPVNAQVDSLFFTRLPLEIRLLIYGEVIGSWGWTERLHITPERCPEHPGFSEVEGRFTNLFTSKTFHHAQCTMGDASHGLPRARRLTNLSMFVTCHRLYNEAIPCLYSKHTFDMTSFWEAHAFLSSLTQHNLSYVKKLYIIGLIPPVFPSYAAPHLESSFETKWLCLCSLLCRMEGLQDLWIGFASRTSGEMQEMELLRPLMGVNVKPKNGVKTAFVVQIPVERPSMEMGTGSNDENEMAVDRLEVLLGGNGNAVPFKIDRKPVVYGYKANEEIGVAIRTGHPRRRMNIWECMCIPFIPCLCIYDSCCT